MENDRPDSDESFMEGIHLQTLSKRRSWITQGLLSKRYETGLSRSIDLVLCAPLTVGILTAVKYRK